MNLSLNMLNQFKVKVTSSKLNKKNRFRRLLSSLGAQINQQINFVSHFRQIQFYFTIQIVFISLNYFILDQIMWIQLGLQLMAFMFNCAYNFLRAVDYWTGLLSNVHQSLLFNRPQLQHSPMLSKITQYERIKIKINKQRNKDNHFQIAMTNFIFTPNKQISYQNHLINFLSNYFQTFIHTHNMFTPSLDHLHILVMLVIAFFSFRAYNHNALAIQYQPQEEKLEQANDEVRADVPEKQEESVENSEMRSEDGQNVPEDENSPAVNVVQVDSINSMNVEEANSANIQSDLSLGQNMPNELSSVQESFNKIDEESFAVNSSEVLEKEEDQESTLVRGESRLSQQECDEQNAECSSSSSSSSGDSSSEDSSEGSDERESRREKRKRIQKAKRVQKKNLRRQPLQLTENQVELIVID